MRNSPTPAPADPYAAVTNSDVDRQPVVRRRRTWSAPVALDARRRPVRCRGAPTTPTACCGSARSTAHRPGEPPVRLLAGHRDGAGLADVLARPGLDGAVGSDDGQPVVRGHAQTGVPVRDDVSRRLQQHRGHARRRGVVAYWTDLRETGDIRRRSPDTARTPTSPKPPDRTRDRKQDNRHRCRVVEHTNAVADAWRRSRIHQRTS